MCGENLTVGLHFRTARLGGVRLYPPSSQAGWPQSRLADLSQAPGLDMQQGGPGVTWSVATGRSRWPESVESPMRFRLVGCEDSPLRTEAEGDFDRWPGERGRRSRGKRPKVRPPGCAAPPASASLSVARQSGRAGPQSWVDLAERKPACFLTECNFSRGKPAGMSGGFGYRKTLPPLSRLTVRREEGRSRFCSRSEPTASP